VAGRRVGRGVTFKVSVAYIELYNEQLCDLLRPPKQRKTHGRAPAPRRSSEGGGGARVV